MGDLNIEEYAGVEERLIKVYPYELPLANKADEFVGAQTVSVAYITQDQLDIDDELLLTDDAGYKYFEMVSAITSEGKLDFSAATSTLGQELKEEDSFICLSNWYYEGELADIKQGNLRFMPCMMSIGKPFNAAEYEAGNQTVYIPTTMVEAQEGEAQYKDVEIDPEGLYEFQLANVTALESSFVNCKVMFTEQNIKEEVTTPDNKNGVRMAFENHTLINGIQGKGRVQEFADGVALETEYGEIEFISKQPLAPFKMTPIETQNKLTMYADWFDYDVVLPFVFAEKFKGGAALSTILTNKEDRYMVEDMLVVSDAFANSFAYAPRLETGDNAGKIDPTYRLGWSGMKVEALENKDPVKVIDGIYEKHLRLHPAFEEDALRYRPAREVINALSRYIYSSYAIGKGQNAFNEAYLPWVLKPFGTTNIGTQKDEVPNNDPTAAANSKVNSYRLKDGVLFEALSTYFRADYSDNIKLKKTNELILPTKVNLSNIKLLQTDRKLTLPRIGNVINAIDKLPLPGDINTKSSNDLSYIWYLPIADQTTFEEFMLNTLDTHTSVKAGQDLPPFLIPDASGRGADGKVYTQAMANDLAKKMHPGTLKQPPLVTQIETEVPGWEISNYNIGGDYGQISLWYKGQKIWNLQKHYFSEAQTAIQKIVQQKMGYEDLESITVPKIYNAISGGHTAGVHFAIKVTHSEFQEAIVTSSLATTVKSFSFEGREVLFDKQQWKAWINTFKIIPTKYITYDLLEVNDFKIAELDELVLYTAWGNFVELQFGSSGDYLKIPLFNATDETVGAQRIIFT